ncbi:MAG: hypothetical protein HY370_06585 [Proteobacteria bacterium]|nr:hypothetical protein [Pseudomonadota bacterium]
MKKSFFTAVAPLLLGATIALAGDMPESMDDVVKVRPVEGGYGFELSHYTCSKDKRLVTLQTAILLDRPGEQATEEKAAKLTVLYSKTIAKAMGEPLDAWIAQYDAATLAQWKDVYEKKQPLAVPSTQELGNFLGALMVEKHAFNLDAREVIGADVEFHPNLVPVPAEKSSLLCK